MAPVIAPDVAGRPTQLRKLLATIGALLIMSAAALVIWAQDDPMSTEEIAVLTADGHSYRFTVEVARTEREQECGLMFRKSLAADRGMIFPNAQPRVSTFWMHNTLIPLDMLFVQANGRIANIERNATPMSDRIISSKGRVSAVVELPGRTSEKFGLQVGDKVLRLVGGPVGDSS